VTTVIQESPERKGQAAKQVPPREEANGAPHNVPVEVNSPLPGEGLLRYAELEGNLSEPGWPVVFVRFEGDNKYEPLWFLQRERLGDKAKCELTTHRLVQTVFLLPLHRLCECLRQPTAVV